MMFIKAATTLVLALATTVSGAPLEPRGGGLNMDEVCNQQYPGRVSALFNPNFDGWKCIRPDSIISGKDVNMPRACVDKYGQGSRAVHGASAYSWKCT